MKFKIICLILFSAFVSIAKAQNYGTWKGAKEAVIWSYDLASGTGTGKKYNAAGSSESTKDNPGFLPYPPVGVAKVIVAPEGGRGFSLNKSALTFTASKTEAPNKFSIVDIPQTAPVGSLFFTLSFNDGVKGTAVLAFGNSQAALFKNTAAYTNTKQTGVFGAVRFIVGSTFTNPEQRVANGSAYVHKPFDEDLFEKSGYLNVEIYSNNSNGEQSFTRKGNLYTLPASSFRVFVNNKAVKLNGSENLKTTGELDQNMAIDALLLTGSSSAEQTLELSISNIKAGSLPQN